MEIMKYRIIKKNYDEIDILSIKNIDILICYDPKDVDFKFEKEHYHDEFFGFRNSICVLKLTNDFPEILNIYPDSFLESKVIMENLGYIESKLILVGCEESQAVTVELRKLGHEAYSCDLMECSGGHPEWHIKGDVLKEAYSGKYEMGIFFPPCTFMSRAGARWMYPTAGNICPERFRKAMEAKDFFFKLKNAPIDKISLENPLPLKIVELPKETQVIQPYQFGHEFSKRTLLWLKNLPELKPTDIKENYVPYLPSNTGGKKRGQKATYRNISQIDASKTFKGIAKAMAEQWTKL